MSAKSLRKAQLIVLDERTYGALVAYARLRGARSLAAGVRLALRAFVAGEIAPSPLWAVKPRRVRGLRLQLEPELRAALEARSVDVAEALQAFLLASRG